MARGVGQHHGDLRHALIAAALDLVAESAADEVTLRAVARRAGVSAAAPYHHFPDKDALLAAVARDGFAALASIQRAVLIGPGTAASRLARMVEQYVLFASAHRTHYGLMFRTLPTEIGGAEGEALQDAALSGFARLVEAIRAANPTLSADAATQRALLAWAFAHGAVDIGRWGEALRPGYGIDELAADVGRSVVGLAMNP